MKTARALGVATLALLSAAMAQVVPASAVTPPVRAAVALVPPPRAYVTNIGDNNVAVIDRTTNTVVTTIAVGGSPWEVTVTPDGTQAYVTNVDDGTVSVIDTATDTVIDTIPVGVLPTGVAFTPAGTRAYVVNGQSETVSVIDTATRTVVATIPLPTGANPVDLAISPDGSRAYVPNGGLDTVSVIDTATNTIVTDISVGSQPFGVAATATRVYVSNRASNTVSVINRATNTVVSTIPVGLNPSGVALSPNGATLYVANADSGTVSVVDTATNTVTATVNTGAGIALAAAATRVYLATFNSSVTVIATPANAVVATIPIPGSDFSGFLFGIAVGAGDLSPAGTTPTISTQASPRNFLGGPVTDTATLSGASSPTGSVIFTLYSDSACAMEVFSSTNPVTGMTATSRPFVPSSAGTYYWRAVYTGDANNNPAAGACGAPNESVVIAPFAPPPFTRTITGDVQGPVTVNGNESVQIVNARVVGPVTVNPGGALTVVNSQISGGIVANSPGFLSVCGTQVSRPSTGPALAVDGAKVPIRVGDTSIGCAGNRFAGDVSLNANAALTFGSNTVSGGVGVTNGGPGATVVKRNGIFGTLTCTGNDPPPNNARQRNTVGAETGQCVLAGGF